MTARGDRQAIDGRSPLLTIGQDHRIHVTCHGAVIALQAWDERLLHRVRALLPVRVAVVGACPADVEYDWTVTRGADGDALHRVVARELRSPDADLVADTRDEHEAAARLADDLEFRMAVHARERLVVHAAAVAWQGRVVLVPGRSFSGKSTLAAALLRAGATYLSDEWAVLGDDGLVHPFPRPLRLRDQRGAPLHRVPAPRLGAPVAASALPASLVVWTTYEAGAPWRPRRMSAGQTALALLDNAPAARRAPADALRIIARVLDAGVVGLRCARGDADETARHILRALSPAPEASV